MSNSKTAGSRSVVIALQPEPQSAPLARAVVRELLAGSGVEALLDAAELCVSELVTNAVLHASTPLRLEVEVASQVVRLRVHDHSPNVPVLARHTSTASTGRGLALVAAIADAWGVEEHGADGKTVWCELTEGAAAQPNLDIDAVVAAWELSTADDVVSTPDLSRQNGAVSVVLLARYPVRLGLGLQEHYEAVVRECQLIAARRDDGLSGTPQRLLDLATLLAQRYNEELSDLARPDPRRVAAQVKDLPVVDLTYEVSPEQLERLQTWQQVLDDVDEFSARGDLLVPTIPPALAQLRSWALTEFVQQCAGASPRPWSGAPH